MTRYIVIGEVTVSVHTIVDAASPEIARSIAAWRGNSTGIIDSGDDETEWVTGDELDGDVKIVGVEVD